MSVNSSSYKKIKHNLPARNVLNSLRNFIVTSNNLPPRNILNVLYLFYLKVANEIINIKLSAKFYLHETYCIVLKN